MLVTGPSGRSTRRPKSACAAGLSAQVGAQCTSDMLGARRESARAAHAAAPVPDLDATPKPRRPQPPLSARSRDSGFSCYQGLSAVEHLRWEMQASSEQCRMAVRTELGPLTEVLCDHIASAVNQTVTEVMVGVRAELAASREEQLACVREELLRLREEHVAHSSVSKDLLVRLTGARQHEQPLEQTTVGQQLDSLQLELAALRRELHSGMTECREDARLAAERGASELRALAAEQHRDAAAAASAVTAEVARAAQEQRRALAAELHEAAGVREELHAITKGLAEGAVGLGAGDRAAPRAACAEGAAAAVARISAMHAGTPPAGGARTAGGGDSKRDELETVAEH